MKPLARVGKTGLNRFRLLARHPCFVLSVWLWGGAALATGITLAGLFRVQAAPPGIIGLVRPDIAGDEAWHFDWSPAAVTPESAGASGVEGLLASLSGLAVLCMLMALANVTALLAGRRVRERRDRSIRLSLGASARDLARDRTRRSRLLNAGAGVVGLVAGFLASAGLRWSWPVGLQTPDPALALPAAVTAGFLIIAFLPRRGGGTAIDPRLLGGRAVTARRGMSRPRATIAGIQFAVAVTIIATGATLLRSAPRTDLPAGDEIGGLLGIELELPGDTPTIARAAVFGALLERSAGSGTVPPETIASPGAWLGTGVQDRVMVECGECYEGGMLLPLKPAFVTHHTVSYGFVEAVGIPIVSGRSFNRTDGMGAERVAMVNETFARESFEGGRPLGRRVQIGGPRGDWYTIVGVVRDRVVPGLGAPREKAPAIYLSVQQEPPFAVTVASRRPDVEATEWLDRILASLEVSGRVGNVTTIEQAAERSAAPLAWFARLFAGLASLALLLAVAGISGQVAEAIAGLRRELAIRVALGGRFRHLARVIGAEVVRTITVGTCLGLMGAFTAGRIIQMHEPALRTLDMSAFLAICALLAAVALATAVLETRRQIRAETATLLGAE